MSYSKIFFYTCLFFILGVFLRSILQFPFFISFIILLLSIFLIFLSLRNKYFLILGLWGLFLFLGILRFDFSLPQDKVNNIHHYNGQAIELIGIVNKEADQREDKVKYTFKTEKISIEDQDQEVKGTVLVTSFLFPEYDYGDRLQLYCNLQAPEPIEDFAYDKYLARYDIYSLCYYPTIKVLDHEQGNIVLASIFKFKNHFTNRLNKVLPEPHSSFLAGLLIGAKKSIPADLKEIFNQTGTTHIIAVSGYNVTIIATFLLLFAQNLGIGRKKAFWLIILLLIIFDIITGLQASIIRASIMGALVLLANYLGRLSSIRNALALTAVIMLLINPKILVFDLGFQLSFLATLGLVYFNPVLNSVLKVEKFIKLKSLRVIVVDYFLTTMSAIILTTPLILYNFGKISLIAPLANILILPFIPIAMLLGFIAGVLSLVSTQIGWVAGWAVWLVLQYEIVILESLANLNWAYFEFDKIGLWLMIILYLVIIGFVYKYQKKGRNYAIIKENN